MVGPLDRKLLRDLARMKGQAAAIAAVIGLGVLMQVMMGGLVNTLEETRAAYYDRYRLADVFAQVTRAPNRMAERIARMPAFGLALTKKAVNQAEDLMGLRAGIDSVFGLHHVAHSHNAEVTGDSLAGLDARGMRDAARDDLPSDEPGTAGGR